MHKRLVIVALGSMVLSANCQAATVKKFGTPPCGNVLNITVIDLRNYIVRHIRHMGLSDEVMAAIRSGMAAVEGMDEISLWAIVQNVIYPKHTPDDMLRGGTRQRFER